MINPLRSEAEAFRLFVWVLAIIAILVLIVVGVRAVS